MSIQTRSHEGELRNFDTLRQALDFADGLNSKVTPFSNTEDMDKVIWKISFSLGDERVRLIWRMDYRTWILEQMDDLVPGLRR